MSSWDRSWVAPVGGLSEIAVDSSERYVLIVSPSGRGLYDLATGERVARDRAQPRYDSDWLDEKKRRVRGIGPLASEWLDAVGLWGGSLITRSGNGLLSRAGDPAGQESVVLHTVAGEITLERGIVTKSELSASFEAEPSLSSPRVQTSRYSSCRPTSGSSGLRAVICYSCFPLCARPAAAEPQSRWATPEIA